MKASLRVLILNGNPIERVPPEISNLRSQLRILGLASTLIRELPIEIRKLRLQ